MTSRSDTYTERRRQFVVALEAGETYAMIAAEHDLHRDTVREIIKNMLSTYGAETVADLPARVRLIEGDWWVDNPAPVV